MTKEEFKFNKAYYDKKFKRIIKKNEVVKMTEKRAEDVVKNVLSQADKFKEYKNFKFEKIEPVVEDVKENE